MNQKTCVVIKRGFMIPKREQAIFRITQHILTIMLKEETKFVNLCSPDIVRKTEDSTVIIIDVKQGFEVEMNIEDAMPVEAIDDQEKDIVICLGSYSYTTPQESREVKASAFESRTRDSSKTRILDGRFVDIDSNDFDS